MLLNQFKNYTLLYLLKKNLKNSSSNNENQKIQKVGLIIDETHFVETNLLIQELISKGIVQNNLKIIVYRDKLNNKETYYNPTFSIKHLSWSGKFNDKYIVDFCNEKFDLLISYYDIESAFLVKLTNQSKSNFKVGFSSVDKRLNHFIIATALKNYIVLTNELFKYLKILNKI